MKERLYAIKALRNSKGFVLVTEEESMMYVNLDRIEPAMQLIVLKEIYRNLGKSIKDIESKLHGR